MQERFFARRGGLRMTIFVWVPPTPSVFVWISKQRGYGHRSSNEYHSKGLSEYAAA